jgi:hypothetical protein
MAADVCWTLRYCATCGSEEQTVCAGLLGQFLQQRDSLANRDEWLTVPNVSMASIVGLSEKRTTVTAAANNFGLLRT